MSATDTAHYDMNYVAFTVINGALNEVTIVPEPATIGLLSLGGLALLRRKR